MKIDLNIDNPGVSCENIMKSLNPDNDPTISMTCDENELKISIVELKISSLYNTIDDIIRCYEISKKINESRM